MMSGNTVANIIVVDDIEQSSKDLNATLIEFDEINLAAIGWVYNSETGKFNPVEENPVEENPVEENPVEENTEQA